MGRFLGKCKGSVAEVAVVGVRTRARAALAMAAAANTSSLGSSLPAGKKIRKVSTTTTTRCNAHELRRRRRAAVGPENSSSCRPETMTTSSAAANCSSTGEICSDFPASCCSSNNASCSADEVVKDRLEIIADPEQVESAETSPRCFGYCRAARTENNPIAPKSDDQDSPPRCPDEKSTVQIKMPSDSEIEDFFAAAEKDLHKRFTDKYNFDIVKDVPLEGRYEWVPIKP